MLITNKETEFLAKFKKLLEEYNASVNYYGGDSWVSIPEVKVDGIVIQQYCEFSIYDVND